MNAIIIIAPNREYMLEFLLPGAERLADRSGASIEVITRERFGLPKTSGYNYKTFEKFQAGGYTCKYDRILRLDADIVISPDCPDVFELFPPDKLWAVYEDSGNRMRSRRKQIQVIQNALGKIPGWDKGYFNAGVILTSAQHYGLYGLSKREIRGLITLPLGKFKEQNVVNWRARDWGYDIGNMKYKFNHMSKHKGDPAESYIVHLAGKQSDKMERMEKIFTRWYSKKK